MNKRKNENFKEYLQIKKDEDKERILRLQIEFKQGKILEEDIKKEDYDKLIELYGEQNKKLKEEIKKYKNEIAQIIKNMKK